jgi:26S proteasome regulatory subunit N3
MPDVEMKPAEDKKDKKDEKKGKKEEKKEEPVPPPTPQAEIKTNLLLIDRAVSTLEPRFTHRVLRTLTGLRRRLDDAILKEVVETAYPKGLTL